MMMLGLVLHSAIFTATYAPISNPSQERVFYLIYDFIHTFRMPAFFLISGFFAAVLFEKYGAAGLLSNRLKRILLPLLIFWPVVTLMFQLVFEFQKNGSVQPVAQEYAEFYHLWFLSFLIYLNFFMIVIAKSIKPIFTKEIKLLKSKLIQLIVFALLVLGLAIIPNTLDEDGAIKIASQITPDIYMLGFYLIFFGFGWLCFYNPTLISNFNQFWYLFLVVGLIGYFGHLATSEQLNFDYRLVYFGATISLSLAFLGLAMRLVTSHSAIVSYFAQSSYWIYIVHLPIVLLALALLDNFQLSLLARFALVLIFTVVVTTASYHLVVRAKPIGRLLGEPVLK
jgi:glucans biosynthesis protein C